MTDSPASRECEYHAVRHSPQDGDFCHNCGARAIDIIADQARKLAEIQHITANAALAHAINMQTIEGYQKQNTDLRAENEALRSHLNQIGGSIGLPKCPRCGSENGVLGTENAYFVCQACRAETGQVEQYWLPGNVTPGGEYSWLDAVKASPWGRPNTLARELAVAEDRVQLLQDLYDDVDITRIRPLEDRARRLEEALLSAAIFLREGLRARHMDFVWEKGSPVARVCGAGVGESVDTCELCLGWRKILATVTAAYEDDAALTPGGHEEGEDGR